MKHFVRHGFKSCPRFELFNAVFVALLIKLAVKEVQVSTLYVKIHFNNNGIPAHVFLLSKNHPLQVVDIAAK